MNKKIICLILWLLAHQLFFAALVDMYRKGTIKILPDPNYGKGNDWESLFYDVNKSLVVTADGSVFVTNTLTDNVFKFSPQGRYLLTLGQRGEGVGDLLSPGDPSVLDNHLLLIGEDPMKRMVSLFHFSGKINRKIRCNKPVFGLIALGNEKIAYTSILNVDGINDTIIVIIKDLSSMSELIIDTFQLKNKNNIQIRTNVTFSMKGPNNDVILARDKNGNLVVGVTNSPIIKIYSQAGRLLKSITLKLTPIQVTDDYIEKFKEREVASLKDTKYHRPLPDRFIKRVEDYDFSTLFEKVHSLYINFTFDPEGNLLVFPNTGCIQNCKRIFQVYSGDGNYICDCIIDKGQFEFDIDSGQLPFVIHGNSLYGLFERKGSDDISLELVKTNFPTN
jgi:hypothetical protein